MYSTIREKIIQQLLKSYADATNRQVSTVGRLCSGDSRLIKRLECGGYCSGQTYTRVLQYFSDNWPIDLTWPADIPRPDPAPDSPAVQAMTAWQKERGNLNQSANESETDPLTTLNTKGHIADPEAFCKAISFGCAVQRTSFDQVVRQYSDGRPRANRMPRSGSNAAVILRQLVAAGDARFASRASRAARLGF